MNPIVTDAIRNVLPLRAEDIKLNPVRSNFHDLPPLIDPNALDSLGRILQKLKTYRQDIVWDISTNLKL